MFKVFDGDSLYKLNVPDHYSNGREFKSPHKSVFRKAVVQMKKIVSTMTLPQKKLAHVAQQWEGHKMLDAMPPE